MFYHGGVQVMPYGRDGHRFFYNGKCYGRIVAGFCFPGRQPGYACVLGESFYSENGLLAGVLSIDLLHELEGSHFQPLLEKLSDAVNPWQISTVYSHLNDQHRHYIGLVLIRK